MSELGCSSSHRSAVRVRHASDAGPDQTHDWEACAQVLGFPTLAGVLGGMKFKLEMSPTWLLSAVAVRGSPFAS